MHHMEYATRTTRFASSMCNPTLLPQLCVLIKFYMQSPRTRIMTKEPNAASWSAGGAGAEQAEPRGACKALGCRSQAVRFQPPGSHFGGYHPAMQVRRGWDTARNCGLPKYHPWVLSILSSFAPLCFNTLWLQQQWCPGSSSLLSQKSNCAIWWASH